MMDVNLDVTPQGIMIVAGVLVGGYMLWRASGAVKGLAASAGEAITTAVDTVTTAVNPANPENVVNKAVTAVGRTVVGPDGPGKNADGSWTLGGAAYDIFHPNQPDPRKTPGKDTPDPWDGLILF